MGDKQKNTNSLSTRGLYAAYAPTKGVQPTERDESISKLAERLRATPNIDHAYVAALAIRELAETSIQLEETARKMHLSAEQRVTDSSKLCAAYEDFFDLLSSPSLRGLLNARARLAKDPVQAAKADAFKLWEAWQADQTLHKSGAAFDRYVVTRLTEITATKTVERWRRMEWSKNRDPHS